VLPRDISVPVSNGNAVLVAKQAWRELLAGYRQYEAGTYQSKLQQALSSLEHAQKPATRGYIEMNRTAADSDVFSELIDITVPPDITNIIHDRSGTSTINQGREGGGGGHFFFIC